MEYLKPEIKEIPNSLLWGLRSDTLANKQYLKHLDFIKENMAVNYITITPGSGLHLQNL